MSEETQNLILGLGGILIALLTAVYTVGGRGALMRREIKQEAEIASLLPDGTDKKNLEAQVSSRLAVYRARLVPYGRNEQKKMRLYSLLALTGLSTFITFTVFIAQATTDGLPPSAFLGVAVPTYLGCALAFGAWLGVHWRSFVLWRQRRVHQIAAERLSSGEQPFGVPKVREDHGSLTAQEHPPET